MVTNKHVGVSFGETIPGPFSSTVVLDTIAIDMSCDRTGADHSSVRMVSIGTSVNTSGLFGNSMHTVNLQGSEGHSESRAGLSSTEANSKSLTLTTDDSSSSPGNTAGSFNTLTIGSGWNESNTFANGILSHVNNTGDSVYFSHNGNTYTQQGAGFTSTSQAQSLNLNNSDNRSEQWDLSTGERFSLSQDRQTISAFSSHSNTHSDGVVTDGSGSSTNVRLATNQNDWVQLKYGALTVGHARGDLLSVVSDTWQSHNGPTGGYYENCQFTLNISDYVSSVQSNSNGWRPVTTSSHQISLAFNDSGSNTDAAGHTTYFNHETIIPINSATLGDMVQMSLQTFYQVGSSLSSFSDTLPSIEKELAAVVSGGKSHLSRSDFGFVQKAFSAFSHELTTGTHAAGADVFSGQASTTKLLVAHGA